jgi:outer membrane protein assembly factor BamB
LGPSYSGPIVSGERVFVTETVDAAREQVRALDRATGRELWRVAWDGALSVPFFAKANGDWIRATPACDGPTLYVAGMRDVLVALDAATGQERWRVDFVERFKTPLPAFGFVSSPLADGEHLYVQAAAGVVKLDRRTGQVVWRSLTDEGGMMGSAFSSPVVATLAGRRQLVVQTRVLLAGLDLESGETLWSVEVPAFRGMNILTPTVVGDTVLTSSYGGKTFAYRVRTEPPKGNAPGDPRLAVETAWSETSQGYMSSPVVIDGHAYMHLRNQRLICLDLATGQRTWSSQPFGQYWSMVARGDRILALDEQGELFLVRAQPDEFTLLDRRPLGEAPMWGHLAVAGDQVLVRELEALAVYRWREPSKPAAPTDGAAVK